MPREQMEEDQKREKRSPVKTYVLRILTFICTLVLCLLLVELVLRAARSKPWYEQIVEQQMMKMDKLHRVGRFLFPLREDPVTTPKADKVYRIYYFGDSFTYGQGVPDVDDTFVHLVNVRLNERQPLPTPHRFESYNGGISASLTPHWVQLCNETLDAYDPDLVVAVFFLRDGLLGVTSMGQIDLIRQGMQQLMRESFLFRYSQIYRLYRERSAQVELARQYLAAMKVGYLGRADQTQQWRQSQADLLTLKRHAASVGAPFAVVIFPVLFALQEDYPLRDVCDEIARFCKANDIPVHSLLPTFMGQKADPLWVSPFDQHPNERGHALAAKGLYPFVAKMIREGEASKADRTTALP